MGHKQKVGRYMIEETLGAGAMGEVYKALDPQLQRMVAIKTIHTKLSRDPRDSQEFRVRFDREARTNSVLNHPHIVAVHDYGVEQGEPYLVMELIEGQSLQHLIEKNPNCPDRLKLQLLSQVASALDFAHRKEVIHRDIKPANILVTKEGSAKIVDFGLARLADMKMTTTGMVMGTPAYTSPEQVSGKPIGPPSDLFSFGMVAFELMTGGKRPFAGDSLSSIIYHITHSEPDLRLADLADNWDKQALRKTFAKIFHKNPKSRYPTAMAFVSALIQAAPPTPDATYPLPAAPVAPAKGSSRTWFAALALFLTLLIAIVAAGTLYLARRSQDPSTTPRTAKVQPGEDHQPALQIGQQNQDQPLQPQHEPPLVVNETQEGPPQQDPETTTPTDLPDPHLQEPLPSANGGTADIETDPRQTDPPQEKKDHAAQIEKKRRAFLDAIDADDARSAELALLQLQALKADTTMETRMLALLNSAGREESERQQRQQETSEKEKIRTQFEQALDAEDPDAMLEAQIAYKLHWPEDRVVLAAWEEEIAEIRQEKLAEQARLLAQQQAQLQDPSPRADANEDRTKNPDNGKAEAGTENKAEDKVPPSAFGDTYVNSTGIKFIRLKAGQFQRTHRNGLVYNVILSKDFFLSIHEITQAQFEAVMGYNPSERKASNRPVVNLTWKEARAFTQTLNRKEDTVRYRIPSEAEWEYACRAGSITPFSTGTRLNHKQANFKGGPGHLTEVGAYPANAYGFYDMHGNAAEWVYDMFGPYPDQHQTDPTGPESKTRNSLRVVRGGSFESSADHCTSTFRGKRLRRFGADDIGFRILMEIPP